MANYRTVLKLDSENDRFLLEIRDRDTGALVTSFGNVEMSLDDLTGTNKEVRLREFHFKDATTCTEYKAWVLMTLPEVA